MSVIIKKLTNDKKTELISLIINMLPWLDVQNMFGVTTYQSNT